MDRPPRPELLALLADVQENPDDLTPWLVLTDWLEEHGDESDRARAEYCRLCFDKLGQKTYASDWEKGERRRELFRLWKQDWLGGLAELPVGTVVVHRGLLRIQVYSGTFFPALHQGLPSEIGGWIELLDLHGLTSAQIAQLAFSPLLDGPPVVQLHIEWNERLTEEAALALAQSPYLTHVRTLAILGSTSRKRANLLEPLRARFGNALKLRR